MTAADKTAEAAARVREVLGHQFFDPKLLRRALTHRSHASEHEIDESYERLEFLGDAVLQLAVTGYLFIEFPELSEGELAKVRAAVVDEPTLAQFAREMDLGPLVLFGRGEVLTGGSEKDSILSDVMESVIGAIYLEAGFPATSAMILEYWAPLVDQRASSPGEADYKTRLQELLAQSGLRPRYVIADEGPEHEKLFTAEVFAGDRSLGSGTGTSKKRAEQAAAEAAATELGG
jgi:ribonuclease-3